MGSALSISWSCVTFIKAHPLLTSFFLLVISSAQSLQALHLSLYPVLPSQNIILLKFLFFLWPKRSRSWLKDPYSVQVLFRDSAILEVSCNLWNLSLYTIIFLLIINGDCILVFSGLLIQFIFIQSRRFYWKYVSRVAFSLKCST